jgi:hypothetical protein
MREALVARVDCSLTALAQRRDKDWVTVRGHHHRGHEGPHRSGGSMFFATLDDLEGSVEILAFEKVLGEYETELALDRSSWCVAGWITRRRTSRAWSCDRRSLRPLRGRSRPAPPARPSRSPPPATRRRRRPPRPRRPRAAGPGRGGLSGGCQRTARQRVGRGDRPAARAGHDARSYVCLAGGRAGWVNHCINAGSRAVPDGTLASHGGTSRLLVGSTTPRRPP